MTAQMVQDTTEGRPDPFPTPPFWKQIVSQVTAWGLQGLVWGFCELTSGGHFQLEKLPQVLQFPLASALLGALVVPVGNAISRVSRLDFFLRSGISGAVIAAAAYATHWVVYRPFAFRGMAGEITVGIAFAVVFMALGAATGFMGTAIALKGFKGTFKAIIAALDKSQQL